MLKVSFISKTFSHPLLLYFKLLIIRHFDLLVNSHTYQHLQ